MIRIGGHYSIELILSKIKKNRLLRFIIRTIAYVLWRVDKLIKYFKKDVHISVEYVYYNNEKTGKLKKKPDSFNIYIIRKGKAKGLWSKIDWNNRDKVINLMKNTNGHVVLDMHVGMGMSSLFIPRWAKEKIVEQIEEIESEYGGK